MAEIVVVHGYAGSGKSTQSWRLENEGFQGARVQHISAGETLRSIRTGNTSSEYATIINAPDAPSPLPDAVVSGAIFESVRVGSDAPQLILIDGYPRHPIAVQDFYEELHTRAHTLLGTIAMQVSEEVSVARILERGERLGEKVLGGDLESYARHRYQRDRETTDMAVVALGELGPIEAVDANSDILSVYTRFKQSIAQLALRN